MHSSLSCTPCGQEGVKSLQLWQNVYVEPATASEQPELPLRSQSISMASLVAPAARITHACAQEIIP